MKACEHLLTLTSELKTQLVVGDSQGVANWRRERQHELEKYIDESKGVILDVSSDLSQFLNLLEAEITKSQNFNKLES